MKLHKRMQNRCSRFVFFSSQQAPYTKGEMQELGERTLGRACTAGRTERVTYVGEF